MSKTQKDNIWDNTMINVSIHFTNGTMFVVYCAENYIDTEHYGRDMFICKNFLGFKNFAAPIDNILFIEFEQCPIKEDDTYTDD